VAETTFWEYRVKSLGSLLREPKDEDVEALLNEWGEEGWEVISLCKKTDGRAIIITAKRPLTSTSRRRRSMPG
jgi:hypothetical protein